MTGRDLEIALPEGACDCAIHVYEPRYSPDPTSPFPPPVARAESYRTLRDALGLQRVVVAQPTAYAFDNRCTLEAMSVLSGASDGARGTAVVRPDVDDAELESLDRAGMRGVRFIRMFAGAVLDWSSFGTLASKLAAFDWHINIRAPSRMLGEHASTLMGTPCRIVIDCDAGTLADSVGASDGAGAQAGLPRSPTSNASFDAVRGLLDTGRCWIKLAAPGEAAVQDNPRGASLMLEFQRELVSRYPTRCVWASNWPHPNMHPVPDEVAALRWLLDLAGGPSTLRSMLVDTPATLYRFSPIPTSPHAGLADSTRHTDAASSAQIQT